jgi:hypothetical protein
VRERIRTTRHTRSQQRIRPVPVLVHVPGPDHQGVLVRGRLEELAHQRVLARTHVGEVRGVGHQRVAEPLVRGKNRDLR